MRSILDDCLLVRPDNTANEQTDPHFTVFSTVKCL